MKKTLVLIIVGTLIAAGCGDSGDTPVEVVKTTSAPAAPSNSQTEAPDNVGSAIQGNPNMPQAAKDALLGTGK